MEVSLQYPRKYSEKVGIVSRAMVIDPKGLFCSLERTRGEWGISFWLHEPMNGDV